MTAATESAKQEWEQAYRALVGVTEPALETRLGGQIEAILGELRRRVGGTFTPGERDLLAAVLDARLSVASNSLNAIMKRLTAFTVILMVPTLIAGIYGMNFHFMPELGWSIGYPFALLLMVASAGLAIFWFWRNDWF